MVFGSWVRETFGLYSIHVQVEFNIYTTVNNLLININKTIYKTPFSEAAFLGFAIMFDLLLSETTNGGFFWEITSHKNIVAYLEEWEIYR